MKFLKENTSIIYRLVITHIAMAVFGLVVFLWTNLSGDTVMLGASILSALFYAVLVYTTMWEYGAKDKPAIDGGRMKLSLGKGFFLSLAAEAIFILFVIAFFICSFFKGAATVAADIYGISYILLNLLDSCFTGIVIFVRHKMESDALIALVYLLGSLFISAVSCLGYLAGTKELHIVPKKQTTNKK